jgi:hypothetical protein
MLSPLVNTLNPMGRRPLGQPFGGGSTLLDGLEHAWKLDEASGIRYDSVGSDHFTDFNGTGSGAGPTNGPATAAWFDHTNGEYLQADAGEGNELITGYRTFSWAWSMWYYIDFDTRAANQYMTSVDDESTYIHRFYHANNDHSYNYIDGNKYAFWDYDFGLVQDQWNWCYCEVDPADRKLISRVNAAAPYASNAAWTPGSLDTKFSERISLGATGWGTSPATMRMSNLMIWNRPLTADEQTQLQAGGTDAFYPFG